MTRRLQNFRRRSLRAESGPHEVVVSQLEVDSSPDVRVLRFTHERGSLFVDAVGNNCSCFSEEVKNLLFCNVRIIHEAGDPELRRNKTLTSNPQLYQLYLADSLLKMSRALLVMDRLLPTVPVDGGDDSSACQTGAMFATSLVLTLYAICPSVAAPMHYYCSASCRGAYICAPSENSLSDYDKTVACRVGRIRVHDEYGRFHTAPSDEETCVAVDLSIGGMLQFVKDAVSIVSSSADEGTAENSSVPSATSSCVCLETTKQRKRCALCVNVCGRSERCRYICSDTGLVFCSVSCHDNMHASGTDAVVSAL